MSKISPLASVSPNAKIGNNVTIEPFATIYGDVSIGDDSWIGPNTVIMDGARIGKNFRIFPGAVVSAIPQDLKFAGEKTTVEIGDNVTVRECVTINRGTIDKEKTVVGDNCLLMAYVHIAHDCTLGKGCILANCVNLAGHVQMGDYVAIEGVVGVQQFVHIGSYAFIAAGSNVRKNIPPFIKVAREPLAFVGTNSIGMKRRGMDDEAVKRIEMAYKILFIQNKNIAKGVEIIETEIDDSPEKTAILDFIANAKNGLVKGFA